MDGVTGVLKIRAHFNESSYGDDIWSLTIEKVMDINDRSESLAIGKGLQKWEKKLKGTINKIEVYGLNYSFVEEEKYKNTTGLNHELPYSECTLVIYFDKQKILLKPNNVIPFIVISFNEMVTNNRIHHFDNEQNSISFLKTTLE